MKTAKVTLADATYYLAFDGEAMFTLRDDFGGTQLALEAIEQDTRESFAATCAIAAVLAERGELLRRRLGYDPGAIPEKDDFLLMVRPFEIVTLKRAIMTAIELGYGREVTSPADDEIDEGLAELNQKKTRYGGRNTTVSPFFAESPRRRLFLWLPERFSTFGSYTYPHTVRTEARRACNGKP